MTIQKINTFKIALDCLYHDANLTAYQLYPEVFQWMKMNNYKTKPRFVVKCRGKILWNYEIDPDNNFIPICFNYGYDRPKTSAFKEMISLN